MESAVLPLVVAVVGVALAVLQWQAADDPKRRRSWPFLDSASPFGRRLYAAGYAAVGVGAAVTAFVILT